MKFHVSAKWISILLAVVLVVTAGGFMSTGQRPPLQLQILAINDFHGQLDPGRTLGGVEYLATLVKQERAETPNTVFIGAGDLIGASPLLSALFHDEPTIQAMDLMGMDMATVGNHEFDEGWQELLRIQKGGCHPVDGCLAGPYDGAQFPYLAANVVKTKNGRGILPPFKVMTVEGVRVGFIGVGLEGTPEIVTPTGVEGLTFLDEAATVNKYVAKLKRQNVRNIVVILHDGGYKTGDQNACTDFNGSVVDVINAMDPEVDVVLTGHTHQAYTCDIGGKIVTSAGSAGSYLTDIDISMDRRTGKVVTLTMQNIPVTSTIAKDPEMTALLEKYRTLTAPLASRVVGSITANITRTANAAGESALGDVIADAQLENTAPAAYGGAVMAFMNPGGIRADMFYAQSGTEGDGNVTYGEVFAVQPFANNLVTLTLTGDQIKTMLETQFTVNRMLQVSQGFSYTWSQGAPVGNKVTAMSLNGVPIDPTASYRVTVNSFLATGGDGFTVLASGTDRLTGVIDLDAFVQYVEAHSPIAPGPQDRIVVLP